MKNEDIGSLILCEPQTGKISGIVTDRDIAIKAMAQGLSPDTPLSQIATQNPTCCREDEVIETAIKLMEEHQVRRLPIVDADDRLVGIISQGDIATRMQEPQKTAQVVEEISQPPTQQYQQEHFA